MMLFTHGMWQCIMMVPHFARSQHLRCNACGGQTWQGI